MIVQCDQCSTKFRLDDSKVRDAGVKVRCSKCRYVFTVFPEAASEDVSFDTLLEGFGPGTKPDDGVWSQPEGVAPKESGGESSVSNTASEPQPASDEFSGSDWDAAAAGEPGGDHNTSAFDFGIGDEPAAADFSGEPPVEAKPQESHGGVTEDSADSWLQEPADNLAQSSQDEIAFGAGEPDLPDWGLPASGENADVAIDEPVPASAEKESIPSHVLFASPLEETSPAADSVQLGEEASPEPPVFVNVVSEDAEPAAASREKVTAQEEGASPVVDDDLPPLSIASRRKGHTIVPIIVTAISIVFVLLLAAGGFYFLKEGPQGLNEMGLGFMVNWAGLEAVDEGTLLIRGTSGTFVKNREAGELFVITGEAVNGYRKPRATVQVRGVVFGAKGEVLMQKTAYCGNALTPEQLATLPLPKIEAAMNNQFGDSLSNLGVPPGKSIPFVLVFSQVPRDAVDYGVEVVGSTVATQ